MTRKMKQQKVKNIRKNGKDGKINRQIKYRKRRGPNCNEKQKTREVRGRKREIINEEKKAKREKKKKTEIGE